MPGAGRHRAGVRLSGQPGGEGSAAHRPQAPGWVRREAGGGGTHRAAGAAQAPGTGPVAVLRGPAQGGEDGEGPGPALPRAAEGVRGAVPGGVHRGGPGQRADLLAGAGGAQPDHHRGLHAGERALRDAAAVRRRPPGARGARGAVHPSRRSALRHLAAAGLRGGLQQAHLPLRGLQRGLLRLTQRGVPASGEPAHRTAAGAGRGSAPL